MVTERSVTGMRCSTFSWSHPLRAAAALAAQKKPWVLLYSAMQAKYSGRYSFLAWDVEEILRDEPLQQFCTRLSTQRPWFENCWFGTLSYELAEEIEPRLQFPARKHLNLPKLWMVRFRNIARFDHNKKKVEVWSEHPTISLPDADVPEPAAAPALLSFSSSLSHEAYVKTVEQTLQHIHAGDFYQANITNKMFGRFTRLPEPFEIYLRLVQANPAPYSAFMECGTHQVLSASPECFLTVDAAGYCRTRPIKGSAKRGANEQEDEKIKSALRASEKNRAENLMITDLMRNDLARFCKPESVCVAKFCELTSYASVHHLSSEITGMVAEGKTVPDILRSCFPPGSMTGAPKLHAIKWCAQAEQWQRGIYSGALGWLGGDGSLELSVVIRTLLIQQDRFEFQSGGGIVAESTPQEEWEELLIKSDPIINIIRHKNGLL